MRLIEAAAADSAAALRRNQRECALRYVSYPLWRIYDRQIGHVLACSESTLWREHLHADAEEAF